MSRCQRSMMAVLSMLHGRTKCDGSVINVRMLTKCNGGNIDVAMFDIHVAMLRKRDGSDIDVTKISRGF